MTSGMPVKVNPRIKELSKLAALDARDMRGITTDVDKEFRAIETRLFSSEGSSGGSRWPALSPDYAKWKARKFPGRKIMQRSGRTRRSLVNKKDAEHIATFRVKPDPAVLVGTRRKVAAYHMPGPLKNRNVPVRDVMQHTRRDELRYYEKIQVHLRRKLERVARVLSAWAG